MEYTLVRHDLETGAVRQVGVSFDDDLRAAVRTRLRESGLELLADRFGRETRVDLSAAELEVLREIRDELGGPEALAPLDDL